MLDAGSELSDSTPTPLTATRWRSPVLGPPSAHRGARLSITGQQISPSGLLFAAQGLLL